MVQQNYPNPFNPETIIKYAIPSNEKVEVAIYNALGQKIKTLVSRNQEAGFYEIKWDASNDYDLKVGSGISPHFLLYKPILTILFTIIFSAVLSSQDFLFPI